MANLVVFSSNSVKIEETKSFADAFPGLFSEEIEEEIEQIDLNDIHYLWTSSETIFKIYKIAKNYLGEHYSLDSNVIIELSKAYKEDIIKTLEYIPYIHSGYIKIILEHRELENG